MEIIREDTGELTATLHLKLSEEDFLPQIVAELNKLQREAVIPGFRKGKVPMEHIKKLYGYSLFFDYINKLLIETVIQYITENQLPILGYPLINQQAGSFNMEYYQGEEPEFLFDIAFTPEIEINFSEIQPVKYIKIVPTQTDIDRQIEKFREQFAELVEIETVDGEAIIEGELFEIDNSGSPKEDGYHQPIRFDIREGSLPQEIKDKLLGLRKDEIIDFLFGSSEDLAKFIGISLSEAENLYKNLQLKIISISHKKLPELNQDFFHQVFPEQNIETLEEFRAEVAKKINLNVLQEYSDRLFYLASMQMILNQTNIPLPKDFLKRWIATDENKDLEEVDKGIDDYIESIRIDLLINYIIEKADIKIDEEDIRNHLAQKIVSSSFPYLQNNPNIVEKISQYVDAAMKNEKNIENAENELRERKIIEFLKSNLPLEITELDSTTFMASITKDTKKEDKEAQEEKSNEIMENNTENQNNE